VARPGLAYAAAALNSIMGRNETTLSTETFTNYFLVPVELSAIPRLNMSMRQQILTEPGRSCRPSPHSISAARRRPLPL
jgi:hypothetical protein